MGRHRVKGLKKEGCVLSLRVEYPRGTLCLLYCKHFSDHDSDNDPSVGYSPSVSMVILVAQTDIQNTIRRSGLPF